MLQKSFLLFFFLIPLSSFSVEQCHILYKHKKIKTIHFKKKAKFYQFSRKSYKNIINEGLQKQLPRIISNIELIKGPKGKYFNVLFIGRNNLATIQGTQYLGKRKKEKRKIRLNLTYGLETHYLLDFKLIVHTKKQDSFPDRPKFSLVCNIRKK